MTHIRLAPEGGRLRTYAFCAGDYEPVRGVLVAIAKATPATDGRRSRQVTMEQIQQIKDQRKPVRKRAAKSAPKSAS